MPRASSSMSSASPSAPGKDRCALPGSRPDRRRSGRPAGPLSCASGTGSTTPATSRPRSAASRAARSSREPTASVVATASPTIAATSSVPERTSRSWPPPCSSGVHSASRRSSRAPAPIGPPSLCPVMVSASTPLAREVDRHLADRLHRVGVQRHPDLVRDRGERRDVAHRADLVVGPHDAGDGDVAAVAERLGQRGRADPAGRLDRQPGDLGAVVLGQPLDAVEDGVVLGRADHDPAAPGVGLPPRPEHPLDGEVVALGAAAGEQHLRRPRPSASASRSRACSAARRAARPLACSDEALPTRPSCSVIAASTSGSIGVVAAWSR